MGALGVFAGSLECEALIAKETAKDLVDTIEWIAVKATVAELLAKAL